MNKVNGGKKPEPEIKADVTEYYSKKYKNKVRPGHKEPNNRAAVKVSVAECNCCGIHLFVIIGTIVLSYAMLVLRSLLWLKAVLLMCPG